MEGTITPSEAIALSGANRGGSGYGFGDGNGWWIILLFLAFGWGGNGGWFGGGSGSGAQTNYVLTSDFATLERQMDSGFNGLERKGDYIQEQLCTMGDNIANQFANTNTNLLTNAATLNNTLATNFATTNSNLMNGFAGVNQGISSNRYENQLAIANLGTELQSCCCTQRYDALQNANNIQSGIADLKYGDAMNTNLLSNAIANGFCQTNYNNSDNTRQIITSMTDGFRNLHDEILANRMEDKNQEIAQLRTALNNANLAASQAAQTATLDNRIDQAVAQLQPTPRPAYIVANPYCGCNTSCGCGAYNM